MAHLGRPVADTPGPLGSQGRAPRQPCRIRKADGPVAELTRVLGRGRGPAVRKAGRTPPAMGTSGCVLAISISISACGLVGRDALRHPQHSGRATS